MSFFTLRVTAADRRKAAGAQPDSAGAQIVLNSDAQISLGEIAERALEDPESRVLLEKLLIRLSQADSRFPENWGKYTREDSNLQPPVPKAGQKRTYVSGGKCCHSLS